MKKLAEIFWGDMSGVKLITIPLYALAAVGVLMRLAEGAAAGDLMLILKVISPAILVLMLAYVGLARVIGVFVWGGNPSTKLFTPTLGIAVWCLFFASSAVADEFGMGLLYLVAAFIETWLFSRAVVEYKDAK